VFVALPMVMVSVLVRPFDVATSGVAHGETLAARGVQGRKLPLVQRAA
jgi:hypothetical protein